MLGKAEEHLWNMDKKLMYEWYTSILTELDKESVVRQHCQEGINAIEEILFTIEYGGTKENTNDTLTKVETDAEETLKNIDKDKEEKENELKELEELLKAAKAELDKIYGVLEDRYVNFRDAFEYLDYYANIDGEDAEKLASKVSVILTVITNVGMTLAVLMSAFMGVKYMLGSVEEKADYKKDMIPYLVGSILLFGICSIVKLLYSIGSNINNI